jgi:hypothetical protein
LPDDPEAALGRARHLEQQGSRADAVAAYEHFVGLCPEHPGGRAALGILLASANRAEEAIEQFRAAVRLEPGRAARHHYLGSALAEVGRPAEAVGCFEEATRLNPEHAEAHKGLSMALLCLGDFARGWREYEWRWKCKDFTPAGFHQPLWDGNAAAGKTIFLHAEQGAGDIFQFVRYAALLKQRGATVRLQCPRQLIPLLRRCAGIDGCHAASDPLPDFDVHVPLMSLPRILGTTLETIPAGVPYLTADPDHVARWRRELQPASRYKIGIVWQGNPTNAMDARRSIPLRQFAALAMAGVQLFSIQKVAGTEQLGAINGDFGVIDLGSRLVDRGGAFTDTAAVMRCLDLVITCDPPPHTWRERWACRYG